MGKEESNNLEWKINMNDRTTEILEPKSGSVQRALLGLKLVLVGLISKIRRFFEKAWKIGVSEPKKVIHGVKVGVALSVVSIFYYSRPLYDGFGGNAMWAVMTVVVVFENTVGATLCKSVNRALGTFVAGSLGVGVHWIASHSGNELEPIILGVSVFFFASAATFSRFIPSVKARFDYGAMIFILTFSLVSVSGYRVDKLLDLAHQRLSTIAVGTLLCVIISVLFCPIWAGEELHNLIHRNLEKLADSLDGCVTSYFIDDTDEAASKKLAGYKCVLNSKAAEDSMANFARWEPAHGRFNFKHPWKQYLKVGASLRSCAYCIETLNGCISSEIQAPDCLKEHVSNACTKLSLSASSVLRDLAITIKTTTMSSKTELSLTEMQSSVEELQNTLKSLPNSFQVTPSSGLDSHPKPDLITIKTTVADVLQLATLVSLLVETAARVEDIVETVNELAKLADFRPAPDKIANKTEGTSKVNPSSQDQHQ